MQAQFKSRLDELLVRRGHFSSRSRARDAIERATVTVAGIIASKPGAMVADDAELGVDDAAGRYVARSALKLVAGLDHFGVAVAGATALDLGASTGGFTQVLLERGAAKVHAVDVGHGQFHQSLRSDPRVNLREGLNARDLSMADLGGDAPDLLVCDVSFISLKLALPPALALAAPGGRGVFLVKPQFEAGREAIGKGGLLRDPAQGPRIASDLAAWLGSVPGWRVLGVIDSPISGGDGNREYLLGAVKSA
ncbi:MAG: TlyA family RNA methyltransferase [Rhizobiaceae bacterium]|nr:TlyA family RNA methyltransferase [Rhizobiaceae bacterium]